MARIAFPDQLDDIEDIDVYVSPEPISDIEGIFFNFFLFFWLFPWILILSADDQEFHGLHLGQQEGLNCQCPPVSAVEAPELAETLLQSILDSNVALDVDFLRCVT